MKWLCLKLKEWGESEIVCDYLFIDVGKLVFGFLMVVDSVEVFCYFLFIKYCDDGDVICNMVVLVF